MWGACAGAALYRREAVLEVGGFDERFFMYLEDVDLALRLRLAGWRCRYEPAIARHASEGSSRPTGRARSWAGWPATPCSRGQVRSRCAGRRYVLYRQAALGLRTRCASGACAQHLGGLASAAPLLPAMLRERGRGCAAPRVCRSSRRSRPGRSAGPQRAGTRDSPD